MDVTVVYKINKHAALQFILKQVNEHHKYWREFVSPNGDVGLADLADVDAGLLCCYYGVIKNSLATGGAGVAYIEDSDSISGEQIAISLPDNVMDRTVIKGTLYDSTDSGVVAIVLEY